MYAFRKLQNFTLLEIEKVVWKIGGKKRNIGKPKVLVPSAHHAMCKWNDGYDHPLR